MDTVLESLKKGNLTLERKVKEQKETIDKQRDEIEKQRKEIFRNKDTIIRLERDKNKSELGIVDSLGYMQVFSIIDKAAKNAKQNLTVQGTLIKCYHTKCKCNRNKGCTKEEIEIKDVASGEPNETIPYCYSNS